MQRSSSGLHIPLAKSTGRIFECQVRMQGSDAMGILNSNQSRTIRAAVSAEGMSFDSDISSDFLFSDNRGLSI